MGLEEAPAATGSPVDSGSFVCAVLGAVLGIVGTLSIVALPPQQEEDQLSDDGYDPVLPTPRKMGPTGVLPPLPSLPSLLESLPSLAVGAGAREIMLGMPE
ncbi:hypothetical protein DL764_009676 [Monosporascus ibericus]|uniref:Uncharacterized protein n=1 Tax=Monosporascus ibericus TaxID=155417 RepID=A0A4Q4SUD0_9PEZI|nr:hypothetical protein DL764_009676 [Monosporascus ibericus]